MGRKNLQQKNKQTDQNKTLVNITDLKVDIRMMDKKKSDSVHNNVLYSCFDSRIQFSAAVL